VERQPGCRGDAEIKRAGDQPGATAVGGQRSQRRQRVKRRCREPAVRRSATRVRPLLAAGISASRADRQTGNTVPQSPQVRAQSGHDMAQVASAPDRGIAGRSEVQPGSGRGAADAGRAVDHHDEPQRAAARPGAGRLSRSGTRHARCGTTRGQPGSGRQCRWPAPGGTFGRSCDRTNAPTLMVWGGKLWCSAAEPAAR
jgi:hypothetical protein